MPHSAPRSPHAAILAIGDEITSGDRVDTNSVFLAQGLLELGIEVAFRLAVPDDDHAIARALSESAVQVDYIVGTGGLGPTDDDLTRQALAHVLGEPLTTDQAALAILRARYQDRGIEMPASNLVQVQRPASALLIDNTKGTAPGLHASINGTQVFLMPGVPVEMSAMWTKSVAPAIRKAGGSAAARTSTTWVRCVGIAESRIGEILDDLMQRDHHPVVGTAVNDFQVNVRVRESGSDVTLEHRVEETARLIEERLQPFAFARDDDDLPAVIHRHLGRQGKSIVSAESCTAGLLGYELTRTAGASKSYLGGWVTYSNLNKMRMIGVSPETIEKHGAVSEPTAIRMALGALEAGQADLALAITGIAGPDGGSPGKPVGTVFIALADRGKTEAVGDRQGGCCCYCKRFLFPGDRDMIRKRSAVSAMAMLYLHLTNRGEIPTLLCEVVSRS